MAKAHGAWVHVDGAFGLWAAAVPELAALTAGLRGADSWGTDAHKTLNVPYDCGIAVVRDAQALRSAMGVHTSYLIQDADGAADPFETVPELSRRARGVPVWAALKSLGPGRRRRPGPGAGAARHGNWRSGWPRSTASRCSTTSTTPRSRWPSATTPPPAR